MFVSSIGETIASLYESGVPQPDIARQLRVAPATVRYHVRRVAIERRVAPATAGRPPTPTCSRSPTRTEVARLLELGLPNVEIARRLGLSKATISYHVRRLGRPVDERCARRY